MSTPLTKDEKIKLLALAIGKIVIAGQFDKEAKDLIAGACAKLAALYNRQSEEELISLVNRAKDDWNLTDEFDFVKAVANAKEFNKKIDAMDSSHIMHELDHHDKLKAIAIGIGKAAKEGLNADASETPEVVAESGMITARSAMLLGKLVNDDDIKWCREKMLDKLNKCGCERCLATLGLINSMLEKKKEQPGKDDDLPEDPLFSTSFGM